MLLVRMVNTLLYRDFFSVQLSPYKIEFGHVCEDPNTWEQRYEKKDFKNHRDMGKVKHIYYLALSLTFFYFFLFSALLRLAEGIDTYRRLTSLIRDIGWAANDTSLRDMRGPSPLKDCSLPKYAYCASYY